MKINNAIFFLKKTK